MTSKFDAIVVGAGCAGATSARLLAESGHRVLVLEKRNHIGGNAYDVADAHGILIHQYGPHIFHTNNQAVFEFLSRFTEWRPYKHRVLAQIHGAQIPVPFNLGALAIAFPEDATRLRCKLIDKYGYGAKVSILTLATSEDPDFQRMYECVYKNVFQFYTQKQWGLRPEEIHPSVTARVPVYISEDDCYFQDTYQGVPLDGYTPMFAKMLDHPNIELRLNTDALSVISLTETDLLVQQQPFGGKVVYSGSLDSLFHNRYGYLAYRTLDFVFENMAIDRFQSVGTVNYTVDEPFTRITECKHLTGQLSESTTIAREFSRQLLPEQGDTPYYPIDTEQNRDCYRQYRALAQRYQNLILLGRLAEYQYYNMDTVVQNAIEQFRGSNM